MSPAAAAIAAVLARQHYLHRAQLRQGATQLGACRVIHPGAEEEAAGGGVGGAEADEHIANAPAASLRPAQLAQRDAMRCIRPRSQHGRLGQRAWGVQSHLLA